MRILEHIVTPAEDGQRVKHLLRSRWQLSTTLLKHLKWNGGILLNGRSVPVNTPAHTGDVLTADGDCHGTIAFAPMGERGFGYDPVFFLPEKRRTFAQLTAEEKNEISHRGNALRVFAAELKEYLEKH